MDHKEKITGDTLGTLSNIFLSREKGSARVEIDRGYLLADFGLEGDSHSKFGSKRQVTVFFTEGRSLIASERLEGLCFARFLETLRIDGINPDKLNTGVKIRIGNAVLVVSSSRKKCYSECLIIKDGRKCPLSRDVRFCNVLESGSIRKGSPVTVEDEI